MNALYQAIHEATFGSPIGALLLAISIVLICVSVVWLAFLFADSWLRPHIQCVGQIVGLSSGPEYSATAFSSTLIVTASRPTLSDWAILIRIGDQLAWATVSKKNYLMRRIGDIVSIVYSNGRFSGKIIVRRIY